MRFTFKSIVMSMKSRFHKQNDTISELMKLCFTCYYYRTEKFELDVATTLCCESMEVSAFAAVVLIHAINLQRTRR